MSLDIEKGFPQTSQIFADLQEFKLVTPPPTSGAGEKTRRRKGFIGVKELVGKGLSIYKVTKSVA